MGVHLRLPRLDSATFRAVITTLQTGVGTLVLVLVDPTFRQLVSTYLPNAVGYVAIAAGVMSLVQNILRADVSNY